MQQKVAAIDLGTNTARLLIGCPDEAGIMQTVLLKRHITRLGGGFSRETGLSEQAKTRTIAAMSDFAAIIKDHGVAKIRAVATSVVRDAVNGMCFSAEISAKTGIALEVIDGHDEAIYTLRGVLSGLDNRSGDFFVFDIGGGSTEYTFAQGEVPRFTRSLPLGVVRLTEGKVHHEAMVDKITRELDNLAAEIDRAGLRESIKNATLIGTAGTATTLAAIHLEMKDYDYRKVNNYSLSLSDIKDILNMLLPMSIKERLNVPGLEKGREDLVIAGILITIKTMEMFDFNCLKICDSGLLEGLLCSFADCIQFPD